MPNLLQRALGRALFGYDAVVDKGRRQPPTSLLKSEEKTLKPQERKKLVSTTRDLARNFTIAAWAIRKHLDYVSTFNFQSRTGDTTLDQRIEELMGWWDRPQNCDVASRHSFQRLIRIIEERRTIDGDVFLLKLKDGRMQGIEGDRIRTPRAGELPQGLELSELNHGIQADRFGRAKAYCVCKRNDLRGFAFERILPAKYVEHHGYFTRFDQFRGISPLAPAINTMRDCYEGFDYALAKMKVAQLFGLVLFREWSGALGEESGSGPSDYEVDFSKGPLKLDLDPGDRAEFLESKSPPAEFRQFAQAMIMAALKGLDIPYSFYDESHTNYSGARQALLQYEQSADVKRSDNRRLLDRLTSWRLRKFIVDGELELPAGITIRNLRWDWIATGVPWVDPLKEVKADVAAIQAALLSRTDVCKSRGSDFYETADKIAQENKYLESLGLPTAVAPEKAGAPP